MMERETRVFRGEQAARIVGTLKENYALFSAKVSIAPGTAEEVPKRRMAQRQV